MGRVRTWFTAIIGAVALLALSGCGELEDLLAGFGGETEDVEEAATTEPEEPEASGEVLLEPAGDPGPNPFTDRAAPEPDEYLLAFSELGAPHPEGDVDDAEHTDPAEALVQHDGYLSVDAATPGLYGGTNQQGSCDPDQIAEFLADNPEKARAWAGVHGIDVDEISGLLDELTPVNLGADTRVLNHGYVDGQATPREAVLQRGTAVLVDRHGVPVVNCECGNPLLEPTVEPEEVYAGERWENFREGVVIVVEPSEEEIESFEVTDIRDGSRFDRPTGTRGEADGTARRGADTEAAGDGCGTVERRETGDVFAVEPGGGSVDCEEAGAVAERYVNQSMGSATEVEGWSCGPATAAGMDQGIAASCHRGDATINLMFDQDDPPVAGDGPPAGEGPSEGEEPAASDEQPDSRFTEEEYCGTLEGDLGMLGDAQASSDGFDLYVRGAEPCEIAEEVATAFLLDLIEWMLSDAADLDALPYEPGILGWECTSGPMLDPDNPDAFFGCRLHNAEIELKEPTN